MFSRSAVAASLFLTPIFAYGAGSEDHGGSPSVFSGDLGNVIWTLVIFLAVLIVLGKFAWGPILSALQKREGFIRDSLDKAKQDREAAEARLKEYVEKIEGARGEASAIVDEGRRDAEVLKRKIEADARKEADALLERAKREIRIATDTAVKEIYDRGAAIATEIAGRVIRKEVDSAAHERLIRESIEELGRLNEN